MAKITKFKIGQWVAWESQAGGFKTRKVGQVSEVVPPNTEPETQGGGGGFGMPRKEESYIVAIKLPKSTRHYWPIASKLAPAKEPVAPAPPPRPIAAAKGVRRK